MTEVHAAKVRGTEEDGVAVFRGIPYAAPPVGELRFAAPHPVKSWDGDATKYGPPAPQAGYFGMETLVKDDHNWLTLNIWTPATDKKLPVMVWIPGGAYILGMSSLPEYDGVNLAKADVVLVTFNYRLGIEGFAQIEGKPANRGLLDQVAALEWVRDNIGAFGGDPDQVTIFGQSAGAGSVAALLAMPRAKGLFTRAIAQSVAGTVFTPELAEDITKACIAEAGQDLSTVDPFELSAIGDAVIAKIMQYADRWGLPARRTILFSPVVDGDVLRQTPWEALKNGAAKDIELIVGHTRDEQRLFNAIEAIEVTEELADEAVKLFAPNPYPQAEPEALYETVHSDWLFRMPSLHLAEAQVTGGGRAYLYELTWQAPTMGATHGLDIPLVFGNLDKGQPAMLIGGAPEAEALSDTMRKAWTGFAKTGDPGWPAYDTEQRLTQVFDTQPTVTPYPEETSRRIWQDHEFAALPLQKETR
ncbi:carboxylesterase family protein [Kibdelosporangium philippinense]|uniref:Carboxylic ester hydrolase n=1 Tax=Kibdelosporangium philippinense TaxID=211113 RepID=A0ABS8ZJL5_9PSEU|nr:carboxylesterase family protein [Kibdelosporangium philippinense]MCE7008003.1 carboxylesterase family protein [Kibdelosporangium philippinense]